MGIFNDVRVVGVILVKSLLSFCGSDAVAAEADTKASSHLVFREGFDTNPFINDELYDTRYANCRVHDGVLTLAYSAVTTSRPSGVILKLPEWDDALEGREISVEFGGGGSPASNSLMISYAVGVGQKLALPSFGYGGEADVLQGDRTGYMIRFLRHGDGTNEAIFYRGDTGWLKKITNIWLESNPVASLRKTVIQHFRNGTHVVMLTFDTGVSYSRTVTYYDDRYPPSRSQREIHVTGKSHSGFQADLELSTDNWQIYGLTTSPLSARGSSTRETERSLKVSRHAVSDFDTDAALRKGWDIFRAGRDYDSVREICRQILDVDPTHDDAMELLGLAENSSENTSDAFSYLTRSLQLRQAKYGEAHVKVAAGLSHLALLWQSKDPGRAERLFKQAVSIREGLFGKHHVSLLDDLRTLSSFYLRQGRTDAAEKLLKRALGVAEKNIAESDPTLMLLLHDMSNLYRNQGRHREAVGVLERLLKIQERDPGTDSLTLASSLFTLALLYPKVGQTQQSALFLKRALDIKRVVLGPDHPEVAKNIQYLAVVYQNQGKYKQAESLYLEAIKIQKKALGPSHPSIGANRFNLGILYMNTGRHAEAEREMKRALEILQETLGPDDSQLAFVMDKLALLMRKTNRALEADYYSNQAKHIRGDGRWGDGAGY